MEDSRVYNPKMKQHLARTLFLLTLSSGQKYKRAGVLFLAESHSVATCEKKNKSSACCSKQPQELTIPDAGFPVPSVSNAFWPKSELFFITWEANVIVTEQVL